MRQSPFACAQEATFCRNGHSGKDVVKSLFTEACVGLLSLRVGRQKRRPTCRMVGHLKWDPLCECLKASDILLGVLVRKGQGKRAEMLEFLGLRLRWLCEIAHAGCLACSCTNSGGFPARSHVVVILNPQELRQEAGLASRAANANAGAIFLSSGWTAGA